MSNNKRSEKRSYIWFCVSCNPQIAHAMQRFILFLLFLCVLTSVKAQYQPALDADTTRYDVLAEVPDAEIPTEVLVFGDTLLAGINYQLVTTSSLALDIDPIVVGGLREDTTAGKMWFRRWSDQEESLVMDLSLEVGDTFVLNEYLACYEGEDAIVTSIEFVGNRKTINFKCLSDFVIQDSLQFVEGVGPTFSPFLQTLNLTIDPYQPEIILIGSRYKTCTVYKDEILFWEHDTCDPIVGSSQPIITDMSVYPNPASDIVHLQISEQINRISLYTISGKIYCPYWSPAGTIDISTLPSGLYILEVESVESKRRHLARITKI